MRAQAELFEVDPTPVRETARYRRLKDQLREKQTEFGCSKQIVCEAPREKPR